MFDIDLASLSRSPSFLRQLRTLPEGYPQVPTSTAKISTAQQFLFMVCTSGSDFLDDTKCHLSMYSSHEHVKSMIMTCLSDGEYIEMSGPSAMRAI